MITSKAMITSAVVAGGIAAAAGSLYFLASLQNENIQKDIEHLQKRERYAEHKLRTCVKMFRQGSYKEALLNVNTLDPEKLSTEQKRTRLLLIADINKHYLDTYRGPEENQRRNYLNIAAKLYERAKSEEYTPSIRERKKISRKIADLYVSNEDWENAYNVYRDNEDLDISPNERWRTRLMQADCLLKFDPPRYYDALRIYNQISEDDDCDEVVIWGEAKRKKADLLVQSAGDDTILQDVLSQAGKNNREYSQEEQETFRKEFRKEAEADYREILKDELLFNGPQRGPSEIGIMKILVAQQEVEKSYAWANEVHFSSGTESEKCQALYLLSKLERTRGKIRKAIEILESSLKRYPKPALVQANTIDLIDMYTDTNQWIKAFEAMKLLMTEYPQKEKIHELLKEYLPGENNIISAMVQKTDLPPRLQKESIKEARELLQDVKDLHPTYWYPVKKIWRYAEGNLDYLDKNYKATEQAISDIINMRLDDEPELKEELLYLDLLCAINNNEDYDLRACRATRYIEEFPQGPNYRLALEVLQDAYFDMKLYNASLDISKRMFIDDLKRLKAKNLNKDDQERWHKTIARMGQCYIRLGESRKAEQLLRDYNVLLLDKPYNVEVFTDWSNNALKNKQVREAIRRLDIVIPYVKDVEKRTALRVKRELLKIQKGKKVDYDRALSLAKKIADSKLLSNEFKGKILQELYEKILAFNFKHSPERFQQFLKQSLALFKDQPWLEYWILKSLTPLFGSNELRILAQEHEKRLDEEFSDKSKEILAYKFLKKQLAIINSLASIEESFEKLKERRDGALYK